MSSVEAQVKKIQVDAYVRLLRVLCAQTYGWEVDAILTKSRTLLNISNQEHSQYVADCRPGGRYALNMNQMRDQGNAMRPTGNGFNMGGMMMSQDSNYMSPRDVMELHQGFGGSSQPGNMGSGMLGPMDKGMPGYF